MGPPGPVPFSLVPVCSYTDPQVSMDLLRAVLQPSFNDDIMAVFQKYQKVRGHTWVGGAVSLLLTRCVCVAVL